MDKIDTTNMIDEDNPILGKTVHMNKETHDRYLSLKKNDPTIFPYQSLDMLKKGEASFATRKDLEEFIASKNDYESKKIKMACPYDLSSDIDIFKTDRDIGSNRFKYLLQMDPDVMEHQKEIKMVIDDMCNKTLMDDKIIFLPFIPSQPDDPCNKTIPSQKIDRTNATIEPHNQYPNILIINNEKFVTYLKCFIPKEKIGEIIHKFNDFFGYYNNLLKNLEQMELESPYLIDRTIAMQQQRIYGLNKKRIAERLWERNEILNKYKNLKPRDCKSADIYARYFSYLANSDKIKENSKFIKELEECHIRDIYPEILYDKKISLLGKPTAKTYNDYYKLCHNMIISPYDQIDKSIIHDSCFDYITDPVIKQNLLNYGHRSIIGPDNCLYLQEYTSRPKFNLMEILNPEWYDLVYNNKIKEAFQYRQLLLGDFEISDFFKRCSLITIADPFIDDPCRLKKLEHDMEWNKIVVSCLLDRDMVFPIRIVNANEIEKIRRFQQYIKTSNDRLVGSLIIKLKGERTDYKPRFYILYVYLNLISGFTLRAIDFRGNVILPGTIIEHIRTIYVEMNTLMYFKEDMDTKLYFYKMKHDNGFDIFVSKYNFPEIIKKYQKIGTLRNKLNDIVNSLEEVKIIKDNEKRFKFVPLDFGTSNKISDSIDKQTGGQNNLFDTNIIFKCPKWDWDIKYSTNAPFIDKDIYSLSTHLMVYRAFEYFVKKMGKHIYEEKCVPMNYFANIYTYMVVLPRFPVSLYEEIQKKEIILKKDITGKIYSKTLKFIKEHEGTFLSYMFEDNFSVYMYICLDKYNMIKNNSKCLILSKNHVVLDAVVYFLKYKTFNYNPDDITFFLYTYTYKYNQPIDGKVFNYLKINQINYININSPLNNENLLAQTNKIKDNVDLAIVDLLINIPEIKEYRGAFIFQTYFSAVIISLQKLNKDGILIVNTSAITNKLVFNFILYLSCYFDKAFIYEPPDIEMRLADPVINSCVIYINYKGGVDINKLLEINNLNYQYDPTGGFNYSITDSAEKKKLGVKYEPENPANKYLNSIVKINDNVKNIYRDYKTYSKKKLIEILINYTNQYQLFINSNNTEYITNKCQFAKIQAIQLAKKYDLPLLEWIEKSPWEYYDRMVNERIKDIDFTKVEQLNVPIQQITIGKYSEIECTYCPNLRKGNELSELAYRYLDKINLTKYKDIELFVNNKQKLLNKDLKEKYDININGKYVSRAWLKMFELLHDTKFLDNFRGQNTLNAFHICEAPGNFINSLDYYIKTKTKIKNYNWHAQSLAPGKADFYDSYGFIKKTIDKWDLGPKNNGDITEYDNLVYYYEKYHGVDCLISDCGEKWENKKDLTKDISIFQMIYALLLPRTGGNFIIKSFATNYNTIYLSLLYIAQNFYEKIYLFKSNINFWSPEIYIVGINKKELNKTDTETILEFAKQLKMGQKIFYLVNVIPENFCKTYEQITYNYIGQFVDIKKFFIFLANNIDIFNLNRDMITKILVDRNKKWIETYINSGDKSPSSH